MAKPRPEVNRPAITRGNRAAAILKDPVVTEAFTVIEEFLKDRIATSAPDEKEKRENDYLAIQGLKHFQAALTTFVEDGKIEEVKAKKSDAKKA
jgi:hypothetical protein